MRIYVASSWRNRHQPSVVNLLRSEGHDVYDFRNPPHESGGFHWSDIDPNWETWSAEQYRAHLIGSRIAAAGFMSDFRAMHWADACVLVMPCGRSAHLELGWAAGRGKRTLVLLDGGEPELMNLMVDHICLSINEVVEALR
jgi:hypothetical protein